MERSATGIYGILTILTLVLTGCSKLSGTGNDDYTGIPVSVNIRWDAYHSKAAMPDEDKVTDISLMFFDSNGIIEKHLYLTDRDSKWTGNLSAGTTLLEGMKYTVCACANFGYPVTADNLKELEDIRYHLAYPDEYKQGIPMYACQEIEVVKDRPISIELERLMAKISISLDRSRLSEDVLLQVTGVRIGNCPKNVSVFGKSRVTDRDGCFPAGFSHKDNECDALNMIRYDGTSDEISLYMLENMQGTFSSPPITNYSQKVFRSNDPRSQVCSYIEISLEYSSDTKYSSSQPLIYRFYLGEGPNSLDVERNCHYRITVAPHGDGLSESGWRVDKSGITYQGTAYIRAYPSEFIRGNIGDRVHIWCEVWPPDTPFDVGLEYMLDDKEKGVYDYQIDEDGHGAVLTLTGPGSGLIYMEAGSPVNDAALFVIEVNLT